MSYILDALRKAEAERARGAIPGVHAQQGPNDHGDHAEKSKVKLLASAVAVLALALAATLGWRLLDRADPPESMRGQAQQAPSRDPNVAMAPAQQGEGSFAQMPAPVQDQPPRRSQDGSELAPPRAPSQGLEQPRPLPVRPPAESVQATRSASSGSGSTASSRAAQNPPMNSPRTEPRGSAPTVVAAPSVVAPTPVATPAPRPDNRVPSTSPTSTPTAAAPPQERILAMNELPDNVRGSLPAYAVSGSSYSENAAARLLIVNNQVAREGDMLPGGALLEQIKQRSAVLRWKGYRFELAY